MRSKINNAIYRFPEETDLYDVGDISHFLRIENNFQNRGLFTGTLRLRINFYLPQILEMLQKRNFLKYSWRNKGDKLNWGFHVGLNREELQMLLTTANDLFGVSNRPFALKKMKFFNVEKFWERPEVWEKYVKIYKRIYGVLPK